MVHYSVPCLLLLGAQGIIGGIVPDLLFALSRCDEQEFKDGLNPCLAMVVPLRIGNVTDPWQQLPLPTLCSTFATNRFAVNCVYMASAGCMGSYTDLVTPFIDILGALGYICKKTEEVNADCVTRQGRPCVTSLVKDFDTKKSQLRENACKFAGDEVECYHKATCRGAPLYAQYVKMLFPWTCQDGKGKSTGNTGSVVTGPHLLSLLLLGVVFVLCRES